jgi:hypothetical protein
LFLEFADASSEVHDAPMLADLLQQRFDLIGRDKVVQVVTDNGANYKAVASFLWKEFQHCFGPHVLHIAWTLC